MNALNFVKISETHDMTNDYDELRAKYDQLLYLYNEALSEIAYLEEKNRVAQEDIADLYDRIYCSDFN